MILDWREREIRSSIAPSLFNNRKSKTEFYTTYCSSLEKMVGFKEKWWEQSGIEDQVKFFEKIETEFKQQSFLVRAFGENPSDAVGNFFNSFFIHPYGVVYSGEESKHLFTDEIESRKKVGGENGRLDAKIIEFTRKLNLPLLLHFSINSHQEKFQKLEPFNESLRKEMPQIVYLEDNSPSLEGVLKAQFSHNFWYNLFSNSDDCIFINHNPEQGRIKFNEYWFASLLHTYQTGINYLDFVIEEGPELRKKYPYHLFRTILFETGLEDYHLLVEGVLGSDMGWVKKIAGFPNIEEFIDRSTWVFSNNLNRKGKIFYGFRGTISSDNKPYHQFDRFIRQKYEKSILPLAKKTGISLPLLEPQNAILISNLDQNQKDQYHGEQFSEAFAFSNRPKDKKEARAGSFVELKGDVMGVCAKEYVKSAKKRHYGLIAGLGVTGTIGAIAITALLLGKNVQIGLINYSGTSIHACQRAKVENLMLRCTENVKEKQFYFDELENVQERGDNFTASVQDISYRFELNGENEVDNFKTALKMKQNLEDKLMKLGGKKLIVIESGLTSCDPLLMLKSPGNECIEMMDYLAATLGDLKLLVRSSDLISKYQKAGLEESKRAIGYRIAEEANQRFIDLTKFTLDGFREVVFEVYSLVYGSSAGYKPGF